MPQILLVIGDAAEVLDTFYPLHRIREDGFQVVVAAPETSERSEKRDKILLLLRVQAKLQHEAEILHRIFEREAASIVEVRR